MEYFHVISDEPKQPGDHFLLDDRHPNGVFRRVYAQLDVVQDIYRNPQKYAGVPLGHEVDVALRELALERVRKARYPRYPSRLACLYVSETCREAEQWCEYFLRLGRPTYGVARIRSTGSRFLGDATLCFDGGISEEENLRMAERYWAHGPREDEGPPIVEILLDGEIEILEIVKTVRQNR